MTNTWTLLVTTILGITAITTAIQTKCSEEDYTDVYCLPEYETGEENCSEFGLNLPWRNTSTTKNDGTIEIDFNFPSHMCNYTKFKIELTVNHTIEKESCTNIGHRMKNTSVAVLEICNDKCENRCKKFQKENDTAVSIPFKHISTGCYQLAVTAYTNTIAEQSITVRRYHATDYKFNFSAMRPTKQCSYYEDSDIVDYTFTLSNYWIMKYIKIEKWQSSDYSISEEKQHYRIDIELPNRINTCLLKNNVDADSALLNCSITKTNSQAYNLECKFTKDILGHYFILKYKDLAVCQVEDNCLNIDNSICIKKIRGIEPPEKDQENSKAWLIVTIICIIVIVSAVIGGAHKFIIEKFRKVLDDFFYGEPSLVMEQKQKILLLYLTDCPLFMDFASKLRKLLSKINDGKVYDLHDPHRWPEINALTENWILTKIHDPSMKFVIIEPRTAIRNRTLPSNSLDEYFHFALKCLSRNIDEINSIRILICRLEIRNNCEYAKYAFMNPFVRINLPSNLDRLLTFACKNTTENDSELDQAKNECFECFKDFTDFVDTDTMVEINL